MTAHLRILIVEDEPLIAMMLEDFLNILGKQVAGVADSVATALPLVAAGGIDAAIVDVHLNGGEKCWPVADALAEAGIPFLVATGGGDDMIVDGHKHRPVLAKPFTMDAIEQAFGTL
ncbi:response regulator [Sphingomonas sp. MS122]|uniref:response regulator n=1 Tax=Sphingomonas sp. MS122 TaxID=3412683 RepID=UPI003C2CA75D